MLFAMGASENPETVMMKFCDLRSCLNLYESFQSNSKPYNQGAIIRLQDKNITKMYVSFVRLWCVAQIGFHNVQAFSEFLFGVYSTYRWYNNHIFAILPVGGSSYRVTRSQLQ